MQRIDKIKIKPEKDNILNFTLHKNNVKKYDNYNYDYDSDMWIIKHNKSNYSNSGNILINKIVDKQYFKRQLNIIKDIKFVFQNEIELYSYESIAKYCYMLKFFFKFANENFNITCLKDIDYEILLSYGNYLIDKPNSKSKQNYLHSFLRLCIKYDEISLNEDILKNNFPLLNIKAVKSNAISHYTKKEFEQYFLLTKIIVNDYLDNIHNDETTFVKMSYWFIAFCTGLNKTALDNLNLNSFECIDDNEIRTYFILGKKNRSKKGHQISQISFKTSEKKTHIFERVVEKLIQINKKYRNLLPDKNKENLFIYQNDKTKNIHIYNGTDQLNSKTIQDYKSMFNFDELNFSTLKIRNQWSNEMFDISKNEKIVSSMLGHESIITTIKHYMKNDLSDEILFKFNVVQKLMEDFSKNENVKNWVEFQKIYNLNNIDIKEINENISNGIYNTGVASCFLKANNENQSCNSYIQCFKCKYFSIIGDKDIWKILSFRESLTEISNPKYNWLLDLINDTLSGIDQKQIIAARKMLKLGRHPFWRKNIMVEQMIIKYEAINE